MTTFCYVSKRRLTWLFGRFGPHFYHDGEIVDVTTSCNMAPWRSILYRWYKHFDVCHDGHCYECFAECVKDYVASGVGGQFLTAQGLVRRFKWEEDEGKARNNEWATGWERPASNNDRSAGRDHVIARGGDNQ